MLKITILTENLVRQRGLLAEHGLSLWIENNHEEDLQHILFDTGQTDVYLRNARKLGIELIKTQAIVISHGHYDHGGGLVFFPEEASLPDCYIHPDAFLPKFSKAKHPNELHKSAGFPWLKSDIPDLEHRLIANTATRHLSKNVTLLADIPHTVDFEVVSSDLLVEKNDLLQPDQMHDEQLLVCSQPQGLVVILGCSHPGVINCLKYVQLFFFNQPIHTIIGGMHLERVNTQRLQLTIDYLRKLDIKQIVPLHCTGQGVIWQMKRELGDRVLIRNTGETIDV